MNLVEWADSRRYLSPESSSIPGRWNTNTVEAARGPMLAMTDPRVKKITVVGPTQLLKTELINNGVGFFIDQDPSPMIVMQPSGDMAQAWSKDRFDKMLRDTPALQGKIGQKRSRDSENTILHKSFAGGHVTVVGSNSPTNLASRPVRIVFCDEVDKYPESAGKEGDPIKLIEERTATFWNSLAVRVCSPTIKGRSRIEAEYELSDKRVYCGKCPHCNQLEQLVWWQVKWDEKNPVETAHYQCSKCKKPWTEIERLKAISNGEYVATAPFTDHAGFKVNKIASPWQPLSVLVRKYLEAKDKPEVYKTFLNTQLAETYEESGERPDEQRLFERRENYPRNSIPKDVVFLTAAVDVQGDRFEVEIVGWCRDKQSYSIDYRVIMANTAVEKEYHKLDSLLDETWIKNDRELQVRKLAIDSGYATTNVYSWVRRKSSDRVVAVDGRHDLQTVVGTPSSVDINRAGVKIKNATKIWPVGVSVIKSETYSWLQLDMPEKDKPFPGGYCHFPEYDLEHFRRLTGEHLINGKWKKRYDRNEQLDCRVYNRAAAAMFGIDRFQTKDWDALEGKNELPNPKRTKEQTPKPDVTEQTPKTSSNDFWDRQKGKKKFW